MVAAILIRCTIRVRVVVAAHDDAHTAVDVGSLSTRYTQPTAQVDAVFQPVGQGWQGFLRSLESAPLEAGIRRATKGTVACILYPGLRRPIWA